MEGDLYISEFSEIFHKYHAQFVRFADSYIRDPHMAEDFTMDAMMYYWENRHKLPADLNIPAYILTSVKNKCISYLRHLETREKVYSKITSDAQWELSSRISRLESFEPAVIFTEEIKEIVRKTLNQLPETTRKIFVLSRFENKSHKDIAAELDISVKSVEFHITKAIKLLRVSLRDYTLVLLYLILQN